jgi:hypothetical protein
MVFLLLLSLLIDICSAVCFLFFDCRRARGQHLEYAEKFLRHDSHKNRVCTDFCSKSADFERVCLAIYPLSWIGVLLVALPTFWNSIPAQFHIILIDRDALYVCSKFVKSASL